MSFSSLVKNDLCRVELTERCCLISELAAIIRINGIVKPVSDNDSNIKIVTENAAFARKIFSVIKKLYNIYPEVIARKSQKLKKHTLYILIVTASMGSKKILESIGIDYHRKEEREWIDYSIFSKI